MRIVKKYSDYVKENLEPQSAPSSAPEAVIPQNPQDEEKKVWWDENGEALMGVVGKLSKDAWLAYLDNDESLVNDILKGDDEKKALALLHHKEIGDLDGIIANTPLNEKKTYRIIDDIN